MTLQEPFSPAAKVCSSPAPTCGRVICRRCRAGTPTRSSYFTREIDFLGNTDHPLKSRILVELNARLGASYQQLGDAHKARAMFTVALESFDRRVRLGADDPFTRYYAAGVHAMRGDSEPALAYLERALSHQRAFTAARARIEPDSIRSATTRASSGSSSCRPPLRPVSALVASLASNA